MYLAKERVLLERRSGAVDLFSDDRFSFEFRDVARDHKARAPRRLPNRIPAGFASEAGARNLGATALLKHPVPVGGIQVDTAHDCQEALERGLHHKAFGIADLWVGSKRMCRTIGPFNRHNFPVNDFEEMSDSLNDVLKYLIPVAPADVQARDVIAIGVDRPALLFQADLSNQVIRRVIHSYLSGGPRHSDGKFRTVLRREYSPNVLRAPQRGHDHAKPHELVGTNVSPLGNFNLKGEWQTLVGKALAKKRPKKGWPKG
jgi:hypothetical protein